MHQGHRAKELREARGWTQEQLRERLEQVGRVMSRPSISQMEDRKWLEGDLIADLSRVFGIPPGIFFDTPPPAVETREDLVSRAFEFVRADSGMLMNSDRGKGWTIDVKLAIVRVYERYTGNRLVPEGIL